MAELKMKPVARTRRSSGVRVGPRENTEQPRSAWLGGRFAEPVARI